MRTKYFGSVLLSTLLATLLVTSILTFSLSTQTATASVSSFPYNQGFEGSFPPTDWTRDGTNWVQSSTNPRTGTYCVAGTIATTGDDTRWFQVAVNFSGYNNVGVSFYERITTDTTNTLVSVRGSKDGGSTWFTILDWFAPGSTSAYTLRTANTNLSTFDNQSNCVIRIRAKSVSGSSRTLRIDDFQITASTIATAPTVTTGAATSVGTTTATLNGNVTSDGGATITERGFYCDTSSSPTTKYTVSGTTGAYTKDMTGLSSGTKYYFEAFATNSVGTSYGSILNFTTQVTLTMATNFGTTTPSVGAHVYDYGTVVDISATAPTAGAGEQYVWNGWTGTGTGSYTGSNNSAQVTMSSAITETASWTYQVRSVSVSISPSDNSGANGATLTYAVTVNNTGNVSDNYSLAVTDNAGWSPSVSPTLLTVSLGSSGSATLSVTIPSGAIGGTIDNITVTATSQTDNTVSASNSCTAEVNVTVSVIIDITLSNVPVNYGTVNPGTENNPATNNAHGFPMTIKVESTTKVNVDIYVKGTDWSDGAGHSIGVENCKYDDDDMLGEVPETGQLENILKLSYPSVANSGYFENVTPGSSKNIYFWISIPAGQWAGTYTNNICAKAVKDGLVP